MPPPAALSSARTTVVPTAMTRAPRARAAATAAQASATHLDEFGVHDMRADGVGAHRLKRPGAHVQRDEGAIARRAPAASASSSASKCRLAVGAATAPRLRANTLW